MRLFLDTSPHKSDFVNVNGIQLNYLDWGGNGPVLLFIEGMGCSAHIFDSFAPRFTDNFRVLGLDRRGHGDSDYPETGYDADTLTEDLRQFLDALKVDRVILAGHSLAYIELCHFTALYPDRVLKLVFLDAAFYNTSPEYKAVQEKNPIGKMIPAWPDDYTIEEHFVTLKRQFPALAAIWGSALEENIAHTVKKNSKGQVVYKMTDAISQAINDTVNHYVPEYSNIQPPVLSIYAFRDSSDYLSSDYMTEEQKTQVVDFFTNVLWPHDEKIIEQFRRDVPHAKIVIIPQGHHYCFIKHEELVFDEMRKFLLE
jgi:pimeloyl-ACP methyl ester carboxylesterase